MEIIDFRYRGVDLRIPAFLKACWPVERPLAAWPTFGGAGRVGDYLVPDRVCGVCLSCVFFVHDVDWALATSRFEAIAANWRLYNNMRNVLLHHSRSSKKRIEWRSFEYFMGVNFGVLIHFKASRYKGPPENHPEVKRLVRRMSEKCKSLQKIKR